MVFLKYDAYWTPGASAVTRDIELQKAPIAAIIMSFDELGSGAAATIANTKTQWAGPIYLKDGGGDITPRSWTFTDIYEYNARFFGKKPQFYDGTAADNKLAKIDLILPGGRPFHSPQQGLMGLVDPFVGFVPQGTPYLHMEVPADGNSIDTRNVKITTIYMDAKPRYAKKWTDFASQTMSTTGNTYWLICEGIRQSLLEAFFYQTSAYNGTLTADSASILKFIFELGGKNILTDGEVPGAILGSLMDENVTTNDLYLHLALSHAPWDNFQHCIRSLGKRLRFGVLGGTADAVKAAFANIEPVP